MSRAFTSRITGADRAPGQDDRRSAPRSARGKYMSKFTPGFFRMFIRKRRAFSFRTCAAATHTP